MGFPPVHTPVSQASERVQALASVHALPSGLAGFEHATGTGSRGAGVWHWSGAVQTTEFLAVHTPVSKASARVQALAWVHGLPSCLAGFGHAPVAGLQVPAS